MLGEVPKVFGQGVGVGEVQYSRLHCCRCNKRVVPAYGQIPYYNRCETFSLPLVPTYIPGVSTALGSGVGAGSPLRVPLTDETGASIQDPFKVLPS